MKRPVFAIAFKKAALVGAAYAQLMAATMRRIPILPAEHGLLCSSSKPVLSITTIFKSVVSQKHRSIC